MCSVDRLLAGMNGLKRLLIRLPCELVRGKCLLRMKGDYMEVQNFYGEEMLAQD